MPLFEWTELIGYRQHRGHRGNNEENAKVKLGINAQEIKSNSTKLTPTWKTAQEHGNTRARERTQRDRVTWKSGMETGMMAGSEQSGAWIFWDKSCGNLAI